MKYTELSRAITTPVFQTFDLLKIFPYEPAAGLRIQLARFVNRGQLVRLKQGIYLFPDRSIDELVIASLLYEPSYVSLETALNIYGIIPDIPSLVTCITTTTTNTFSTARGTYSYSCLNRSLYYGFTHKIDPLSKLSYRIAEPEKALLDWMYLRKIKRLDEFRTDLTLLNSKRLQSLAIAFPDWIKKGLPHE